MSQMHVEVALERAKRRFGVEIELHPPRVPYRETIRREARAHGRYKKQTGGRGQFGDCHIVITPDGEIEYEFVDKIVGGVIPQGFRPAVDKGIQESMHHGELAGAPVQGVRVQLVDGSYHTVDSSEMAFKIAGSMAWKEAYMNADPVLLEPIMELEVSVPDEAVGAVNGDLNSRRGRLQGMEPLGGMTSIKAEVPMAELLTYAQSLTSMTSGRGDYSMHFLRYEEVPTHVAQKIIEETKREREAVEGVGGTDLARTASDSPQVVDNASTAARVRTMRVTKASVRRVCAVCERSLLQGEVALRFSPDGVEFVDVCPLCQDYALDYGWVREGGAVVARALAANAAKADALVADPRRLEPGRAAGRQRARSSAPHRLRGCARRGRRSLQCESLPSYDRRRREGARSAPRVDRPAVGREQ